ncbi:MAG TPA: hypothetical protein VGV35_15930, partial [Bryobacteraceae bacterium]|nr:hypothetical protein [Bryobacteraceae bacterium]
RLSALLRRYVPPTTLPTPIVEEEGAAEAERPAGYRNSDQSYTPRVDGRGLSFEFPVLRLSLVSFGCFVMETDTEI